MNKTDARRQQLSEKLADHLLAHGLQGASLRPLAAAAGTSDRMLLHYFENKEELLTATLLVVSTRLQAMLDSVRSQPMPYEILLPQLAAMLKDPNIRPYLRLWLELAALASSGDTVYRPIARKLGEGFFEWIAATVEVATEERRIPMASLALATLEGLVLLDAIGMESNIPAALDALSSR